MKTTNLVIGIVVIAALIIIAIAVWPNPTLVQPASTALFSCDDGKTINADFFKGESVPSTGTTTPPVPGGSVKLSLSDGRSITLPQTVSANGGRYANSDESFVFWNVGDTATLTENGTTYANCATPSANASTSQTFINAKGAYSFEVPAGWTAFVNQYNDSNSLFGPNASSTSGLGGVEVFTDQKSIDAFLGGVAAKYSNKINIAVDGIPAVRAEYKGTTSGVQTVVFKNGTIYNIYVNSAKAEDVANLDNIVSSFKFAQ